MVLQILRHLQRILAVTNDTQRKRFDALKKEPGVVGRDGGAEVTKRHGAHAKGKGNRCKRRRQVNSPAQSVIVLVGLGGKRMASAFPVKAAGVGDDAADGVAVTAKPFRQRVYD